MPASLVMAEGIEIAFQIVDTHGKAEVGAQICKLIFVQLGVNTDTLLCWNCTCRGNRLRGRRVLQRSGGSDRQG